MSLLLASGSGTQLGDVPVVPSLLPSSTGVAGRIGVPLYWAAPTLWGDPGHQVQVSNTLCAPCLSVPCCDQEGFDRCFLFSLHVLSLFAEEAARRAGGEVSGARPPPASLPGDTLRWDRGLSLTPPPVIKGPQGRKPNPSQGEAWLWTSPVGSGVHGATGALADPMGDSKRSRCSSRLLLEEVAGPILSPRGCSG